MKRKVRGALANLALLCAALILLGFFNRSESNTSETFAWTKVRYRTAAGTTPKTRGICPSLDGSSKPALVVGRVKAENSQWLHQLTLKYHLCVYTADDESVAESSDLQVPANRGHEAMAYLTFIIDNYQSIPQAGAVFVHGSRWAWHNDHPEYDNAALLEALNVSSALEPVGYQNLRCDWSASTCSPKEAVPQGSMETRLRSILEPWNARAASDAALPQALAAIFGDDTPGANSDSDTDAQEPYVRKVYLGRSHAVRAQCCAQFVVSRERIWQHSRDEYIALRQWLLDGSGNAHAEHLKRSSGSAAPPNDQIAGRILSYIWHILFLLAEEEMSSGPSIDAKHGIDLGRLNHLACPRADECYCRLYGRCDLEGCIDPGSCRGQYRVPPNFKLPKDWAAHHS